MWKALRSLFKRLPRRGTAADQDRESGTAVVALVVSDKDQQVLKDVADRQSLRLHFARSCEEAADLAERLGAPVAIFDRNWPGADWRTVVQKLSVAQGRPCVLLASGVVDEYLWQEVIRRGGYDVLAKPLRAEDVSRAVKLALSYWAAASKPALQDARPLSLKR